MFYSVYWYGVINSLPSNHTFVQVSKRISKVHFKGGFTLRFDHSDQIRTSSATVWNVCMTCPAVWGSCGLEVQLHWRLCRLSWCVSYWREAYECQPSAVFLGGSSRQAGLSWGFSIHFRGNTEACWAAIYCCNLSRWKHPISVIVTNHGLYGSTSCCISHGPCQRDRVIFNPHSSETPKPIFMKLEIYNYFPDTTTHAKFQGAMSTWVVWPNRQFHVWKFVSFFAFFTKSTDRTFGHIPTHNSSFYI